MAQVITDIQMDETLHLTVNKKFKHNLPSFGMIGTTDRRTKVTSFDLPSALKDLSKSGTWFFWTLVQKRNSLNIVTFIPINNAQAKQVTKAYKELNELGIIKRIQRGEYIINPTCYLPKAENFQFVSEHWDSI